MMKYNIKEVRYGKNKMIYVPVFEEPSLQIFEEFLLTEVKSFKKQILDTIEKAEANPGEVIEFAGNACILHIHNGSVRIESNIDEAEIGDPVNLKFDDFVSVVNSWIKDTKK